MSDTALWTGRRVLVCVGTGGVGKTTSACALAIAAACAGRRVAVMTIDPSRRLGQALGLDLRRHDMQEVALDTLPEGTHRAPGGSLHALVLDVQATFDAIIRDRAHSPEQAEFILGNRIYKHFSASLAGSHEYAAVEKLWDVVHDDAYDLVVLDTPPAQNAMDFLDAPGRILRFLQGQDELEGTAAPSMAQRLSRSLLSLGGSLVTRTVGKISGAQTLQEVTGFLGSLRAMYAGFRTRAQDVEALLRAETTAFALVGAPSAAQSRALLQFAEQLVAHGIEPRAWVLNRVHSAPVAPADAPELERALQALQADGSDPEWLPALRAAIEHAQTLAARDAEQLDALRTAHPDVPVIALPERDQEPGSLAQLATLL